MTIDLDKLKALAEAATPGPWAICTAPDTNNRQAVCDHNFEYIARTDTYSIHPDESCEANAAFIAAARNAVPELVDEVERLRDRLRAVEAQNDALGNANEAHVQRNAAIARVEQAERERDEAYAVLKEVVWHYDAGTLQVDHAMVERSGHVSGEWTEPACGDDHDACSRETCPAIWVVNDAARIVNDADRAGAWRKT